MIPDRKREIKKPHLFVTKRRSRNHNLRCTTLFGTVQANRTNQTCRNNARRTLTLTETGFGIRAHGLLHALYCCRLAPDDGSLQAGDRATPSVHSLCSYMDMIHFFSRKVKRKIGFPRKSTFFSWILGRCPSGCLRWTIRDALHSVPLDFAVSDLTAAASTPHNAYAPLRGGCILTGRTLRKQKSFASLFKGCGVHGVEPLVAVCRQRNFKGAWGRSHQLFLLPSQQRKLLEKMLLHKKYFPPD